MSITLPNVSKMVCIVKSKSNVMKDFEIRSFTKKELAYCYFPTADDPHIAVNRLMRWINRCTPLKDALEEQGYRKSSKWFTPKEVKLIVEYLGEP